LPAFVVHSATGFTDGLGTYAALNTPEGIDIDSQLNILYISDYSNNAVRKLDLADNSLTTFATSVKWPRGIAVDSVSRFVYVASFGDSAVYKFLLGSVAPFAASAADILVGSTTGIANS